MKSFVKKYCFTVTALLLGAAVTLCVLWHLGQKDTQPLFQDSWVKFGNAYYTIIDPHSESADYFRLEPVISQNHIGPPAGAATDNTGSPALQFYQYCLAENINQQAVYLACNRDASVSEGQYSFAVFVDFVPANRLPTAQDYYLVYGIDGPEDIYLLIYNGQPINDPVVIDRFYHALYGASAFKPDYSCYIDDKDVSHIELQTEFFSVHLVYDQYENVLEWGDTHFQLQTAADL